LEDIASLQEFVNIVGASESTLRKYNKEGLLVLVDEHTLYQIKVTETIKKLQDAGKLDLNNKVRRAKTARTKKHKPMEITEKEVKSYMDTADLPDDLKELIDGASSTKDMAQIINFYWTGKKSRQQFEASRGDLIPIQDAKAVIEMLFVPIDKRLNDIHIDLKNRYPDTHPDAIDWLSGQINDIKGSIQDYKWGK